MRMSANKSNACRRSSRARILARALARAVARTRTTLAKASRKAVGKAKTRAKLDEEEALTASKIRITRTRTSPEATPTLIHGGTPSPLEGSLVPGEAGSDPRGHLWVTWVCIYVPASRHWLISYSPIHLT